jgi:hypothetical protein
MPVNLWGHVEIAFYVLLALVFVYMPPKTAAGLGSFIERHFGDSVGFYILHLGIGLVVLGDIYPQLGGMGSTGNSLIMAAMVALKLTKVPNGSSTTATVETKTTTTTTPPTTPPSATQPATSVTVEVAPPVKPIPEAPQP